MVNIDGSVADTDRELLAMRVWLRDEAHKVWAAAEAESQWALRAWIEAGDRDRGAAYHVYQASLEREEAAACELQRWCELTTLS
jgi:hypothetical protein